MVRLFLLPLSFLYEAIFSYKQKKTTPKKLPALAVWSVGNLSLGGTGKTPFVLRLIQDTLDIRKESFPVVVLSRGYKGKASKLGMEVSLDSRPEDVGDEPLLIKKRFPEAHVLIGKNRIRSFYQFYPKDQTLPLVILDDGFQHFAIQRDLDIVLIDSYRLLGNGWTVPAGFLREREVALRRAHVLVFTRYHPDWIDSLTLAKIHSWESKIRNQFPHLRVFHAREKVMGIHLWKNQEWVPLKKEEIQPHQRILAFCGIGNPKAFFQSLENYITVPFTTQVYPDHFHYQKKEIHHLTKNQWDLYITTEKDIVKFQPNQLDTFEGKIGFLKMDLEVIEENWIPFLKTVLETGKVLQT